MPSARTSWRRFLDKSKVQLQRIVNRRAQEQASLQRLADAKRKQEQRLAAQASGTEDAAAKEQDASHQQELEALNELLAGTDGPADADDPEPPGWDDRVLALDDEVPCTSSLPGGAWCPPMLPHARMRLAVPVRAAIAGFAPRSACLCLCTWVWPRSLRRAARRWTCRPWTCRGWRTSSRRKRWT